MTQVVVGIPAHDEADLIGPCLESVLAAAGRAVASPGPVRRVHLVVAAHRCRDATAERAGELLQRAQGDERVTGEVLEDLTSTTVGQVRDRALRRGLAHLGPGNGEDDVDSEEGETPPWLFCTDADSRVPADWVEGLLEVASREGAPVVTGLVDLEAWDAPAAGKAEYHRRVAEGFHPTGHWHAYGANLAVRWDAYRRAGGFPRRAVGEDVALVRALRAAGVPVASTTAVRVTTSSRAPGRAAGGLGSLLAELAGADDPGRRAAPRARDWEGHGGARSAGREEHHEHP